ncbi:uncharacterized protein LOC129242676 [Anastrepha obliqua]|uniref:uncharacterized protein LOC129242676 n=1 Tax=Anastrepha obliqua TaxID=95512 RepID=UPI00240A5F1F|nr:uncharacterized protein LOC129242676 [Anastrepha obliqua]
MKLAVLAFILGLCLAVAAADIDYSLGSIENDELPEFTPLDFADEITDAQSFNILWIFYFTLKASLRTLKGVNCTIKAVMNLRNVAVDFLDAVKDCNTGALKSFTALISQVQAVVITCNDIIHLNSNVCNNGALDDATDGNKTTPFKCFIKLINKMITLKGQVSKTISLAKKLPSTPATYAGCAVSTVTDLISVFTQYPSEIKTCSKLKN